MNKNKELHYLTQGAIIAALYVVLTYFALIFGLDSGAIQVRISEALTALLYFTPAAIPGLFVGCVLSNFLCGGVFLDILFGSAATLIGALLGYRFRKNKILIFLPNIAANTLIVPLVLMYAYGLENAWWYFVLTVGAGEIISCGILGYILLAALKKRGTELFKM